MLLARSLPSPRRSQGVSMLEVLVAIFVLTIGLLGTASMQSQMQTTQVESYQRAQAIVLLQEMVDRINANRKDVASYVVADLGLTAQDCTTPTTVAGKDLCEWNNALFGAAEMKGTQTLGAMTGARGCITNPVTTMPREVVVAVVWQGMRPTVAPGALPADPCSITPADWSSWMPIHLQGYDDAGFTSTNCTLTNRRANTDVLVVRRARACAAGISGCDAAASGKPYLQVSLCSAQVTPNFKLGLEGTETFNMQKRTCLSTALANKREYLVRIYFIADDNGAGQSIPTLTRLELTGAGWSTVPLVEGIEQLQLHYGLDTNGDGQPDVYVANPNDHPSGCSGTCPRDNWMNAVTVHFHLLARNLETSPSYSEGTKKYILGKKADGTDFEVTPADGYRRHVYSGLVRVANPAGRRDTP